MRKHSVILSLGIVAGIILFVHGADPVTRKMPKLSDPPVYQDQEPGLHLPPSAEKRIRQVEGFTGIASVQSLLYFTTPDYVFLHIAGGFTKDGGFEAVWHGDITLRRRVEDEEWSRAEVVSFSLPLAVQIKLLEAKIIKNTPNQRLEPTPPAVTSAASAADAPASGAAHH